MPYFRRPSHICSAWFSCCYHSFTYNTNMTGFGSTCPEHNSTVLVLSGTGKNLLCLTAVLVCFFVQFMKLPQRSLKIQGRYTVKGHNQLVHNLIVYYNTCITAHGVCQSSCCLLAGKFFQLIATTQGEIVLLV